MPATTNKMLVINDKVIIKTSAGTTELIVKDPLAGGGQKTFTQRMSNAGIVVGTPKDVQLIVEQASINDLVLQDENGNVVLRIPSLVDADRFNTVETKLVA